MKTYEIYMEGFATTGQSGGAEFVASVQANCFKEACEKHYSDKGSAYYYNYNKEHNTYWGCELFQTLHKAQRRFG